MILMSLTIFRNYVYNANATYQAFCFSSKLINILLKFLVTIHLIIKQIRKMVAYVRTGLINNIEQPELLEYSITPENILGEGGCGRVYAGRFRGNNVAIKVIGKS